MSCLDNTDILRIVGGNSFQIAITVKARRVSDGSEIEDFDLSASSPVLNLIHAGEKTRKYFVTQGNQAIISFDGSEGLGYYGMEMSGSYNSEAWRFCIEKVLQLVDTNAKANIPEWSVLVDDTYFIEGTISIYGGGGGGDTVQADWAETNPTSAAFILHKPDLSVYATKTEVASGLAGKQDTIADLADIREGAAAGATAYQKPASGIPESDMSEGVQSALDKAEDAYQLPANGIPASDMDAEVQAALEKANSAVQTETDPVFSGSPAAEITQADINTWNAKQPSIADLADIREGAAAGATAVQPDEMAQAIDEVDGDIADINAKIPTAASNLNQLADKAYVNSSIATNSATYRGSFNLITDLGMNVDATHTQIAGALATAITTADNNDYAFVQIPDSASTPTVIAKIERYKHNGSGWAYEYDLNNSGFTSAQWAAINSGITSGLVGKLADLPNNSELATLLNGKQNVISDLSAIRSGASAGATAVQPADLTEALNDVEDEIAGLDESKQDVIEDLSTIRSGAAAGATAYQKPANGIPESDMSEGVQSALDKAEDAYQKPASGIPATDMSESVQSALAKANSAVQTETDPVFNNSPAADITQADINTWNAKQSAIADLSDIRAGAAAGATAVQPDEMAQAIDEVDGDIADINAKIPATASNLNQLADKAYVNSSIATNSATYRGSFNLITDLGMNVDATHAQIAGALATAIATADNNDYAFVQIPDSASTPTVIAKIERYKHNGSGWVYEYDLNNSGFTAAQWAAINSGITSGLVGKLSDLPNNSELATLLNGKQNVINDLPAIREGAAAGATAYQKPANGIPASDMSSTVQQDLSKANTAVQTETDPIFSASPAAGITAQNIQTWNGEPAARQAADTALQNSVSTLQTNLAAETSARQSADAALQTAIQDEASARATADALLQQQYNALTQSDIIVGDLPATGVPNVIYRVPGTTDFTDYMWYDNQFVPMATYGLPISAEFVVDNNLNKTQEEVNELAAGVFDISVANAVEGTPATYADLSAALGTNGALVPQGFRKGGMSVKFIQSSDNKYVQYRLKATTFSISIGDWIEDNVSIEHNRNLADSAIVKNDTYITDGGGIVASEGSETIAFPCKKNTSYTLSKVVTARFIVMLIDREPNYGVVGTNVIKDNNANSITITTSSDTTYVVAYIYKGNETVSWEDVLASLQIEEGSHATSYVKPGYTAIDSKARSEVDGMKDITENLVVRMSVLHNGLPMIDKLQSHFLDITNGGRTLTPEVLSNALLGFYLIGTPMNGCKYVIRYINYAKNGTVAYSNAISVNRDNGDNTITSLAYYYAGSQAPKGVCKYEISLSNDTGVTKAVVLIDWDALSVIDSGDTTGSIFELYATDNSKYCFDQKYIFGDNNLLAADMQLKSVQNDVEAIKSEIGDNSSINIPSIVYAIPGTELNIWNDTVASSADRGLQSPLNYQVRWQCAKGFITQRCFRYTPTDGDAGHDYTCICFIYNNNFILLGQKNFIIRVVAKNALASAKNIAFFGDSLGATSASNLYTKFRDENRFAGTIPTMVGTRGTTVKYDAFGGARLADFATSGTFAYRISVTGVGGVSLGAKYSVNISGTSVDMTVREVNLVDGSGNLLLEADYGAKVSNFPSSGTITLVSGSGDSSISYTGGFEESGNPLWNDQTEQLDVSQYKELCGLKSTDKIDAVVFQLGINGNFDAELYTQYISDLYNAFIADNANCKFILALSTYGGNTVDGYGVNYGTGTDGPYLFKEKLVSINKLYLSLAQSGNYSNMRIATPGLEVDRYYGYNFSSRPISQEYPTNEQYHNNFIHPASSGYSQIGDSLLAAYNAVLSESN